MKTTNGKIADLLYEQTYDERMEMAKYLSDAAMDWVAVHPIDGDDTIDSDYFAALIGSYAESAEENDEGDNLLIETLASAAAN